MNADWFLEERGIRQDTLDAFDIRFVGEEVIFPYPTGDKSRYWDEDGKRQFRFTKGMKPSLFGPRPSEDAHTVFLCEGETDAMRLYQALSDDGALNGVGVLGLGGVDTWRKLPEYEQKGLMSFETIYLILDNDQDYNTKNHVDQVALDIRKAFGSKRVQRIRLPEDVKDICEFFAEGYNVESLRLLARKGKSISRFTLLDLSSDPPPVRWLVDGLVAMGDVTLFSGPSGIGKSWLTMGMARATADAEEMFLHRRLFESGKVLYIDEENPEDVVYDRLRRLGLRNFNNVRYIWNNGLRLDKNPDVLLDEALDFEPTLIILDSLTRIHSGEENMAGDMSRLLNDGIRPLARETGAAVVLIHHHDKGGNGPRGSGDILASVDGALDCTGQAGSGQFSLKLTKSRRRQGGNDLFVKIVDHEDRVYLRTMDAQINF